jgi:hypothetical protein
MHGNTGVPLPVTTIGGLVTLAKPEALPEGASPRAYDWDYDVGGGKTRAGLTNLYSGGDVDAAGPNGGNEANSSTWNNPDGILVDDGTFASYEISSGGGGTSSVNSTTAAGTTGGGAGVPWVNPANIDSSSASATASLSGSSSTNYGSGTASATVTQTGAGTSTTVGGPITGFGSVPTSGLSASVTAVFEATFFESVGGGSAVVQYSVDSGTTWLSMGGTGSSTTAPLTFNVGITLANLSTLQVRIFLTASAGASGIVTIDAQITSCFATLTGGSGSLTSQVLAAAVAGLSIPSTASITGVQISFTASVSGGPASITPALSVGVAQTPVALATVPTPYTVGGAGQLWGYGSWSPLTLSTLGAQFVANASAAGTVSINSLSVTVFYSISSTAETFLYVTGFDFDLSSLTTVEGFQLSLTGYASASSQVSLQLLQNGNPVGNPKIVTLPATNGATVIGSLTDMWGTTLGYADIDSTQFGVQIFASSTFNLATVFLDYLSITVGVSVGDSNFDFIDTFVAQNGDVKNLALDAAGNFYVEDVTNNPGILVLVSEGITPGSYAVGVNGPDVEYLAITDLTTGSDQPLQYTPKWSDRITQVGPGAPPSFAPVQATTDTFNITGITQPPANSDITDPGHISVLQWSAGPTSTAPGLVLTVFYSPSFYSGAPQPGAQDTALVNAFNSGLPVYVYISGTAFGTGTYLVTSVGNALPPGVDHERYYFTAQMPTSSYQQLIEGAGQYQMTVATMTMAEPVPGLAVGNNVTITGTTPSAWDATWPISETLNSATLAITNTQVTASVATYTYTVTSVGGSPPAAGQLITITNTTNANGALNGTNLTIASSTGGSSGTFTIATSVVTAASVPEDGQGTTAGSIFAFDPGVTTVGTTTNPIYGNTSVGGSLTFIPATAQLIGVGTRQASVIFITRNGYYTAPAPPVTFTCPENTTAISVTQIPIGPPNVVARGIIMTEPGQNGVPGANFFMLPTPVTYIVENVSYTATAFIVNDNVSTTASLSFTDSVLLTSLAVDVYGYNLFNQIEIGDPGWVAAYDQRNAYGLCRNKIQNFVNLSFDGGYLPATNPVPLGWSQPDIYGSLILSPKFGNAYYIKNTSASLLAVAGLIQQSAYQDAYLEPIIEPNTDYSVRLTAAVPSGNVGGNLVVSLVAGGITYGSFTLPFASMTADYAIYEGTLLTTPLATIPPGLQLVVQATQLAVGADVSVDRVDIVPTAIPVLTTTVMWSYAGLPEQVDVVTGVVGFSSENQQPVNGGMVLYDTFYGLKGWYGNAPGSSLYSLQASANLEPADWQEPEVAQRSGGAIGPLAFDLSEQWFLGASRQGLYLFEGGQPGKIMQEIYQIWDAINWAAGKTIWVKVDILHRKIFIGVPLPTPNFWLPNAAANAAPASPNVILMCNYQGIDSGQELKNMPQMHTTMFGTLNAIDMRRKWSIWQIPSPYAQLCQGPNDEELFICNGRQNSKIYFLDDNATTDDGLTIDSLYTTAGLPELSKRTQMQGLGNGRVRFNYMTAALQSPGNVQMRLLPNRLLYPEPSDYESWTLPGGFTPGDPALEDAEASLNFAATRTFVEFRENDGNGFSLSNLLLMAKKDVWNQWRGRTGVTP